MVGSEAGAVSAWGGTLRSRGDVSTPSRLTGTAREAWGRSRRLVERRMEASAMRRSRAWIVILGLLATAAAAPRALAQAAPEAGFSEGDKTPEVRRLATQERLQRLRQARIARLRELAAAKGQTERIAALDKLEAKQTQLYNLRLERIRTRLGDQ